MYELTDVRVQKDNNGRMFDGPASRKFHCSGKRWISAILLPMEIKFVRPFVNRSFASSANKLKLPP